MSHGNTAVLTGHFRVVEARIVKIDGKEILEVEGTIQTGLESHGGLHRVVLYSETARKANAFVQANGGDGMLVTVNGSLHSGKDFAKVFVKYIEFHVPPDVEDEGIRLFMGDKAKSHRGVGILS